MRLPRMLAAVLALIMAWFTLALSAPAQAAPIAPTAPVGFPDVPPGTLYRDEIMWMAETGLTTGYPDGRYRPLGSVNRDAMAAFLYRLHGSPAFTPQGQTFTDVKPDNQFYVEIEWLAASGIADGWADGTFRPLEPVNRDAMAAFLYRIFASEPYPATGQRFVDVLPDNEFHTEIEWLASTGISTGWRDGTFRPVTPVARDAMAAFLFRAVERFGWPEPSTDEPPLPIPGANVVVAQDGSGDFTTVADALAAAPTDGTAWVIGIRPGTYRELLQIRRSNVTLLGATDDAAEVVVTYDNAARTPKPDGTGTYGTTGSATVLITGNDVTARNLTFENSYVETGASSEQAVAVKTQGDRLVFDNVRFLGDQDTLYVDSPGKGVLARSYFTDCYVEGDVDFIFGRGTAVFDRCTLHASSRGDASNNGYITAPSTDISLPYGFLITDSVVTSDAPEKTVHLGRPWHPSGDVNAIGQVTFRETVLPAAIKDAPWADMSGFSWRDARFFEYANTGPGAVVNAERPQLSAAQAAGYTKFDYLAGSDGWNPTGEDAPADTTAPAAPAGLAAEASDGSVLLTWQPVPDADLAGYSVYRAEGDGPVAIGDATRVAVDLTEAAFRDRGLVNQTRYTWVVTAVDRAGNESVASASVTSTPVGAALPAHDVLVAADGSGDFTSVQAALDATAAGTPGDPTVIAVKPGLYRGLVTVSRSNISLIGTTGDARDVVITYDNAAGTPKPDGSGTYGTSGSQTVRVSGSDVSVADLTIENSFDEAAHDYSAEQAVALHTTGDRLVFDNVRVLGNQDTLLVNSPDAPVIARSYFHNSYIEGDVDFIFGRGTAVFERSTIHALSRGSSSNNGYITAASTSDHNPYGFLITDSTITSDAPANTFSLGRPWRGWSDGYSKNGVVYNSRGQVTVRDTVLPDAIRVARPWADMAPNLWTDGRFSEYANTGPGAAVPDPATRPQLTDAEASGREVEDYLGGSDGWRPVLP